MQLTKPIEIGTQYEITKAIREQLKGNHQNK